MKHSDQKEEKEPSKQGSRSCCSCIQQQTITAASWLYRSARILQSGEACYMLWLQVAVCFVTHLVVFRGYSVVTFERYRGEHCIWNIYKYSPR